MRRARRELRKPCADTAADCAGTRARRLAAQLNSIPAAGATVGELSNTVQLSNTLGKALRF
jgi:hypothetical protein